MRTIMIPFLAGFLSLGCGPLTKPMVDRLDPEQQKTVEDSWSNMLAPPDRLGRLLLLDVILIHQMHQLGVDRLVLISEKDVRGGVVVMQVRFDRSEPARDEFTVTFVDAAGQEARRERYTRQEIEERIRYLYDTVPDPNCPEYTEEQRAAIRRLAREKSERHQAIRAATQPAGATPP